MNSVRDYEMYGHLRTRMSVDLDKALWGALAELDVIDSSQAAAILGQREAIRSAALGFGLSCTPLSGVDVSYDPIRHIGPPLSFCHASVGFRFGYGHRISGRHHHVFLGAREYNVSDGKGNWDPWLMLHYIQRGTGDMKALAGQIKSSHAAELASRSLSGYPLEVALYEWLRISHPIVETGWKIGFLYSTQGRRMESEQYPQRMRDRFFRRRGREAAVVPFGFSAKDRDAYTRSYVQGHFFPLSPDKARVKALIKDSTRTPHNGSIHRPGI